MRTIAAVALGLAVTSSAALAQPAQHQGHAGMQHDQMAKPEYMKAMQGMHQAMMGREDADPDRAFALKMIEHHKGGVEMSQIVQRHGDDAEIKRMAQKTADMQRKEIVELEAWLDRHGGRAPKP